MALPRKFKHLLEIELSDVEPPDYASLVFCVCACEVDACGWSGWLLEAAFKADGKTHDSWTGDRVLSSDSSFRCPRCARPLYRTGASVRVETVGPFPPARFEYESLPIEYDDEERPEQDPVQTDP